MAILKRDNVHCTLNASEDFIPLLLVLFNRYYIAFGSGTF